MPNFWSLKKPCYLHLIEKSLKTNNRQKRSSTIKSNSNNLTNIETCKVEEEN